MGNTDTSKWPGPERRPPGGGGVGRAASYGPGLEATIIILRVNTAWEWANQGGFVIFVTNYFKLKRFYHLGCRGPASIFSAKPYKAFAAQPILARSGAAHT